jgi:hypothetical protein
MNDVGNDYLHGRGVGPDLGEALGWYRRAVAGGDLYAEKYLGDLYRLGLGVPQSDAEAIRLYELSAKQGYRHGETAFALMLLEGRSVPKDVERATTLLKQAAVQDDQEAIEKLAELARDAAARRGLRRCPLQFGQSRLRSHAKPAPVLTLTPHLVGRLVFPEPDVNRMAQEAVGRPGQKSDLGNKVRLDPMYSRKNKRRSEARRAWRWDVQRRCLAGERIQAAPQVGENLDGHSRADTAGVDELAVVRIVAEQQRAEVRP